MAQKEIPQGAVWAIAVLILALFGGMIWWRTSVHDGDDTGSKAVQARESTQQFNTAEAEKVNAAKNVETMPATGERSAAFQAQYKHGAPANP